MVEKYVKRVHSDIVLDIGGEIGALIIYTREGLCDYQIDVSLKDDITAKRIHTDVLERRIGGRPVFAAVFAELQAGAYVTWSDPVETFTIVGGQITELSWQDSDIYVPPVSFAEVKERVLSQRTQDMLPPRYRDGKAANSAPMASGPMRYTEDGEVAWDEMWTSFCDLALAGGPSHRDTMLEPVPVDDIYLDQESYGHVYTEIERGLRLVTGLPIVPAKQPGWIGLVCEDKEMAKWLLQAIIVENVCVRRENNIIFLPVGPNFKLEKEVKNVITVVAKTHHYWLEHLDR